MSLLELYNLLYGIIRYDYFKEAVLDAAERIESSRKYTKGEVYIDTTIRDIHEFDEDDKIIGVRVLEGQEDEKETMKKIMCQFPILTDGEY